MNNARVFIHLNVYGRPYEPALITSLVNISYFNKNVEFFVRSERNSISHLAYRDVIQTFLTEKEHENATHLLLIDGIVSTPKGFVESLVREKKDVVSAMVPSAEYPYSLSAWRYDENGLLTSVCVKRSERNAIAVDAVSFGCVLFTREALEKVGSEPFHNYRSADTALSPQQAFCKAMRDKHLFIWVTPRVKCERMRDTQYKVRDNVERHRRVTQRQEYRDAMR